MLYLQLLDIAFCVAHTLLIVLNLVGWAFRRTRVLHLVSMAATAFSWFGLGLFYGWGYCPCTDWHFRVRRALGYDDGESNYIQLLAQLVPGLSLTGRQSQWIAWTVFAAILAATALAWFRQWRQGSKHRPAPPADT